VYQPIVSSVLSGNVAAIEDFKARMADEIMNTGNGLELLGEDVAEQIVQEAQERVGELGIDIMDEDEHARALKRAKARIAAQYIDLNNAAQLQGLANAGNFGAGLLLRQK
jgi:trimethylamine:corrinoid methyltransferase-like protein